MHPDFHLLSTSHCAAPLVGAGKLALLVLNFRAILVKKNKALFAHQGFSIADKHDQFRFD
nr:MAG TPA_asm: hypothetical protein [Caudoviricetes sp.]